MFAEKTRETRINIRPLPPKQVRDASRKRKISFIIATARIIASDGNEESSENLEAISPDFHSGGETIVANSKLVPSQVSGFARNIRPDFVPSRGELKLLASSGSQRAAGFRKSGDSRGKLDRFG